jgi:hypothetical protein
MLSTFGMHGVSGACPLFANDCFKEGLFLFKMLPMAPWHFLNERSEPKQATTKVTMGGDDALASNART